MFRKPVGGPRIVPFGEPRRPADKLANGHPGFRVTQRFGDWNAILRQKHNGMDIGNFYCRERVSAMEAGIATLHFDTSGALGVSVKHPNGYTTEYWHLSRFVLKGTTQVSRGQLVGYHGSTGLDIGGCHLHVTCYDPQGRLVDVYPLIDKPNG